MNIDSPRSQIEFLRRSFSAVNAVRIFQIYALFFLMFSCATPSQNNPSPSSNIVTQANQYARDGLYREAIEAYKKAKATDPKNVAINRNLGMVLVKAGDYKGAIKNLELALTRYSQDADANFYLAESYRAENRLTDAIFRYQSTLKLKPSYKSAMKSLAWSYYRVRAYSEALTTIEQYKVRTPHDEQAVLIKARILIKLKREQEAMDQLQVAMQSIPSESLAFFRAVQGDAQLAMGQEKKAEMLYLTALKDQPLLSSALLGYGKILIMRNQKDQAREYLDRSLNLSPQNPEAYYLLSVAYEKSNSKKSLAYLRTFVKQAAHDPEYSQLLKTAKNSIAKLGPLKP